MRRYRGSASITILAEPHDYETGCCGPAALGDDTFTIAWREGRDVTLESTVKYALSGEDTPHHTG
jgi:hypothetical protein